MKNPNSRFNEAVVIITGGTSGIGAETAKQFADEGAIVAITGRRVDKGEKIVADIQSRGGEGLFIKADHTQLEDCQRVVEKCVEQFGRIDVLFNNAGIVLKGTAEETEEHDWQAVIDINITAVWRMSKLVIPYMRERNQGVIINNASDWGLVGGKSAVAYCTSKGAVIQMTKAMALDHARENIRINAICPGDTFVERWVEEGYYQNSEPISAEEARDESEVGIPMGRVGEAEEIARAVLFLASDDASFITGTTLVVDGGNTAR